tara:strand:- start:4681 stop:5061 length:381 start_codon:yes stop_codon:yes gene_type:complete
MNRDTDMDADSLRVLSHDMQRLRDYMAEVDLGPPVTAFYDLYVHDYNKLVPKFEPSNVCITIGLVTSYTNDTTIPFRLSFSATYGLKSLIDIENVQLVNGAFFDHSRRRIDNALNDVKLTIISGAV